MLLTKSQMHSQWTNVTHNNIYITHPYSVNGDTINIFMAQNSWFTSYNNGETWFPNNYKNELSLIPSSMGEVFFSGRQYINNYWGNKNNKGLFISEDYGETYIQAKINAIGFEDDDFGVINDIEFIDENNLLLSGQKGIFLSSDKGYNWIYKNLPGCLSISYKGLTDLDDKKHEYNMNTYDILYYNNSIYSATLFHGGGVYKSIFTDIFDTNSYYSPISHYFFFREYNGKLPHNVLTKSSNRILENNGILFSLFVNIKVRELWKSEDFGETWINMNFAEEGLIDITGLHQCGDVLYIVDKVYGVFMSVDNGENWVPRSIGFDDPGDNNQAFGEMHFNDEYAFINKNLSLYRAPLKDCQIVEDVSSVDIYEGLDIKVYPNPANESVTISGINEGKVEIYNSFGQLLINSEIQGNSTINTSNLKTGIYIIKIESNSEVKFEKIIISR
jgi:hypothetical protein